MKLTFNTARFCKILSLFAILDACLLMSSCSTAWTTEASQIITLLVPAIQALLGILSAVGVSSGLAAEAMSAVNTWSQQATQALLQVKGLIEQYNAAEASAQPGILTEIETALKVITDNLGAILPTVHVTNPENQAKIMAVVTAIGNEIAALVTLLPAVQGKVTSSEELKALVQKSGYLHPKEFRATFNKAAGAFGKQYQI